MLDIQLKQPKTLAEVINYMRALEDNLRWALANIDGEQITEGSIKENQLAQGAVTSGNIAKGSITNDALGEGAIAEDKLSEDVWKDIEKRINQAGFGLIASNELKERVNDLINIANIDWHKITDDNGQIMTADGAKIRFERLAVSADNMRNLAEGQMLIKANDGIYALTAEGTEKMTITADAVTQSAMDDIAQNLDADTLFDRTDVIAKIEAMIDAKMGG